MLALPFSAGNAAGRMAYLIPLVAMFLSDL